MRGLSPWPGTSYLIGNTRGACYRWPLGQIVNHDTLYVTQLGRRPAERRVALGLSGVRESLEQFGDARRWIPTEHTLFVSLTKSRPTGLLAIYCRYLTYVLAYDHHIKDTKWAMTILRQLLPGNKTALQ